MEASALSNSIRALRSSINSLNSWVDSLEPWLYFWVALVVIGVVAEIAFIIWEYKDERKEWRRGTIRSPEKPSGRKLIFELVAAAFVAIGVAGELFLDVQSGRIQTDLRTKNGELSRLLESAAGSALDSAIKAESHLADAQKEASDARTGAANAEQRTAEMQKRLASRSLTLAEREAISREVQQFSGNFVGRKIKLNSYILDAEGMVFALEVADILQRAGIEVNQSIGRSIPVGQVTMGLNITGPTRDGPFISTLLKAVHSRLDTTVRGEWNDKYSELDILVGVKPVELGNVPIAKP